MFIRFEVAETQDGSGQPVGLLHALRYLRDDGLLAPAELAIANQVFDWMYDHLDAPDDATLAAHPDAISWFRETATECLGQVEQLVAIVEAHGQPVIRRLESNPGSVVYEDSVQVLALRRVA